MHDGSRQCSANVGTMAQDGLGRVKWPQERGRESVDSVLGGADSYPPWLPSALAYSPCLGGQGIG